MTIICEAGSLLELTSTVQDGGGLWQFRFELDATPGQVQASGPVWLATVPFGVPTAVAAGEGTSVACAGVTTLPAAPVAVVTPSPREALPFTGGGVESVATGVGLLLVGAVAVFAAWRQTRRIQSQT